VAKLAEDYVWWPSGDVKRRSNWQAFINAEGLEDYDSLAVRADDDPSWFWNALIRFLGIRFYKPYERVLDLSEGLPFAHWCIGGTTNLVLNCLDKHIGGAAETRAAVIWESETGEQRRWSYRELYAETCRLAAGLSALGLKRGDMVAIYMPMLPETVAAFLAVAKLGCIAMPLFSGFGSAAIATRLLDGGADAVITVDGTIRRGKHVPMKEVVDQAIAETPSVHHVVVLRRLGTGAPMKTARDHWWHELVAGRPENFPTTEVDAEHALMVVFTSGTSGRPKGTIHTHCGFVTKTGQDMALCFDLQAGDRLFWMTDMGWLVGPVQITAATLVGATLVLAEGAPDYPEPARIWRLVRDHGITFLGIGPTLARTLRRYGDAVPAHFDLSSLRIAASTGEPWDHDSWMWVFEKVCGRRAPLMNYSGGTELGGIVATNILFPIKPASFHGPIPGTGADIVDANGQSLRLGEVGELVMRAPCIGTTRGLWRDRERYLENYWQKIPGMWVHGDWASRDFDGRWYIHGRSDDTIKIAGKRAGPAEIENLLLATRAVTEAAAVGVPDAIKGTALVCAVVAAATERAGAALAARLADVVATGLGGSFRPLRILFVSDLPKTRNMKVMRRLVRAVLTGEPPGDQSSLVNPEAMQELGKAAREGL